MPDNEKCTACDADGWQCERPAGHAGLHACGVFGDAEPYFKEDGTAAHADRVWTGTVRWRETSNRVLDCLMADGEQTPREIGARLGLSPNTVRRHLTILRKEELARPMGAGRWGW